MLMSKSEKIILFSLALVQFTHIMDFMILMPMGPQLMRIFSISPQQFSFLVSAFTLSAGISGFLAAFFIDRFDRKSALSFNYCGFIIGTFACAFASSYELLMAARIFTGFFGGVAGALILSIIGDTIAPEKRGTAMGIVMSAFSLASVAGVPFGLWLANKYSWHAPFLTIGFIGSIVIVLLQFFIPKMTKHLEGRIVYSPIEVLSNVFENANQRRALLLTVCLIMGQFTIIPFISPYLVANVGFTEAQLPMVYMTGGLFSIFTAPMIGKLADKFGKHRIFIFFVTISLFAIATLTNLPKVPIYIALCVTSLFFICAGGRMIPAQALITSSVPVKYRGSFMSINSSIQQFSSGIAAFVAGLIVSKGTDGTLLNYNFAGYVALSISIIGMFVAKGIKTVA